MKASHSIALFASLAILAGCGGAQTPVPQTLSPQAKVHQSSKSWTLPEAKNEDLLYVSDEAHDVYVYNYDTQKQVGKLSITGYAFGLCTDSAQNVYVTDEDYYGQSYVLMYRHGGSLPRRKIATTFPLGCGVNAKNGDLCVASELGELFVYKRAKGTPKTYTHKRVTLMNACAYADNGSLYIAGGTPAYDSQLAPIIAQLPKGSRKLILVRIRTQLPDYVYDIKTDGSYVAVLAGEDIVNFSIHGRHGSIEGDTNLREWGTWQFYFVPSRGQVVVTAENGVWYYEYPSGGLDNGIDGIQHAFGVAVSLAPSRSRTRR